MIKIVTDRLDNTIHLNLKNPDPVYYPKIQAALPLYFPKLHDNTNLPVWLAHTDEYPFLLNIHRVLEIGQYTLILRQYDDEMPLTPYLTSYQ